MRPRPRVDQLHGMGGRTLTGLGDSSLAKTSTTLLKVRKQQLTDETISTLTCSGSHSRREAKSTQWRQYHGQGQARLRRRDHGQRRKRTVSRFVVTGSLLLLYRSKANIC